MKEVTISETTTKLEETKIVNTTSSLINEDVTEGINTLGDFKAESNNIDEALKELGALYAKLL